MKSLLSQRKLPQEGWDDATIEMFIQASSDSCSEHAVQSRP